MSYTCIMREPHGYIDRINLGRGRTIYDTNPNMYITVKERMEDKPLSYKPRAKYNESGVVWHGE